MPTAKEIIERANAAFVAIGQRCRNREQEILRQRTAALSTFPVAQAALTAHATALTKASDDFATGETRIQNDLMEAEQQGEQAQRDADDDALRKWRQADDDALRKLQRSLAEADDTFKETLKLIQETLHTINAEEQARLIQEQSITSAQRVFKETKDVDFETFRRESATALDAHMKAVERARRDTDAAMTKARDARRTTITTADATLRTALNADPLAASIAEAFALQLNKTKDDCEQEKTAVLVQMRKDLAEIGH